MIASKLCEHVTPNWTAPIEFQMTEPVRRLQQRWTFDHRDVRYAHAISCSAKMDLLLHGINELRTRTYGRKFLRAFCLLPPASCLPSPFRGHSPSAARAQVHSNVIVSGIYNIDRHAAVG